MRKSKQRRGGIGWDGSEFMEGMGSRWIPYLIDTRDAALWPEAQIDQAVAKRMPRPHAAGNT